jgi:Protein of unknown function (DUF1353)
MNKIWFTAACMMGVLRMTSAQAEFIGNLEFTPAACEQSGMCVIKTDFRYKDPNGVEWLTKAGDKTDGATIPTWAQPFIGQPFDKMFIKAAVIHDHYCDRHVRPWRKTHRVFYDALMETGVGIAKGKLMYYAVYLAGPKWVELMPGKPCGHNCLFKVEIDALVGGKEAGKLVLTRRSQYDDPEFPGELREVEKLIADQGDKVDLRYLEQRAQRKRPNDYFYLRGDIANVGAVVIE